MLDTRAEFKLKVEAGRTYLVELLVAAGGTNLTAQTRLEVAVTTGAKSANLPYIGRLPVSGQLVRRRVAFRTDEQTEVALALRAVRPGTEGEGKNAKPSYAKAEASDAPLLVGDLVVAPIKFVGANLALDKGPAAKTQPLGNLECEVKPWTGGNSTIRWQPYPAPQEALRLTDGIIGNQDTMWTTAIKGPEIAYAEAVVKFKKSQTLSAVAVYEDNSGPIPAGAGVQEKTAMHYGVYVRHAKTGQWARVGYAVDNTDLVNVFTFPPVEADQVRYFWAGRDYAGQTDGTVHAAEMEVYSAEEAGLNLDTLTAPADDGLKVDL